MRQRLPIVRSYVTAVGLAAVAAWIEVLLASGPGAGFRLSTLSLAVGLSAWHGGLGPGLLTIALSAAAADYLLLGPGTWLQVAAAGEAFVLAAFVSGWAALCVVANTTVQRLRREEAARLHAEQVAVQADRMAQLAGALGRAHTSAAVVEAALQESLHTLRADAGLFCLVQEGNEQATLLRAVAYPPSAALAPSTTISLKERTPLADAVHRGAPVVIESDRAWQAEYPEAPDTVWMPDYEGMIAVPLRVGPRVVAVMRLDFTAPRPVATQDREWLAALEAGAGQALDRVWKHESAERARHEAEAHRERADREIAERQRTEQALRASETRSRALAIRTARMHELTAALSEAVTVNAVAQAVVQHGQELVGAAAGAVSRLVEGGARFEVLHAGGVHAADLPRRVEAESGLCTTEAVQTGVPVFVASWAESQERYWRSASLAADGAHLSSATVPLLVEGAPLGVLEFYFSVPVNFDAEYRALLVSVAQHCAQALDRARLYESAQQARAEAEAANRLKDDFLSIVSHELRTPLNAVVGWSSMLRDRAVSEEVAGRAVQSIYDNAMRQARLIDDLLDVSRMTSGQTTLDLQEIHLDTLIPGIAETIMPAAVQEGVVVDVHEMPAVVVMGDRRRLEQVFFNLLSNALKFTPRGGRITIDAAVVDEMVELWVTDTGVGIEPDVLPHVFDRFRQADSTRTRAHGGLGLGLAIARQFVEAHGGSIRVDSPGPNLGTTFSVRLRVAARRSGKILPDLQVSPPPPVEPAPRLDGVRVLVVDDEPDAREVMAHALQARGARVVRAASAPEAFDLLGHGEFDVLLTDIAMPEEDGHAFIRRVRASSDRRMARIPAAAVTAHAGRSEREQALAAGFQCHLAKPVEAVTLARTVDHLLHGRVTARPEAKPLHLH